jgi:carbon storage regulator CsrA
MQGSLKTLVLSRKKGERIRLGDDIVLEVRRVAGNRVSLAISAPETVRIVRDELIVAALELERMNNGDGSDGSPETGYATGDRGPQRPPA